MAIAWLPGPAGTRRRVAKLSVEEPDAAEPARPDLWGARVSNDPGLPDREVVVGQAPPVKAVVYQWEARKRCPSPVFWCRIMDLDLALPDVAKTVGLSPPPPDH